MNGAVLQVQRPEPPDGFASEQVHHVMEALHLARFGGWPIKWLYFISGLLGTVMVATGANLFMVKRRRKSALEFGAATGAVYCVIEAFSVASMAGICIASIGYLWGNRLLPAELAQRDLWKSASSCGYGRPPCCMRCCARRAAPGSNSLPWRPRYAWRCCC